MQEIDGTFGRSFSQEFINLTKDFCCDSGKAKIIRWVGCKPGVYKGSKTLFTSDDLSMCSWFQAVDTYSYMSVELESESLIEIELKDVLFFFGKCTWPSDSLSSLKHLEIGLNGQGGLIGSIIPFNIESPNPERLNYQIIRDRFEINTSSVINGKMVINNPSPYTVSFSMLYAH